MIANLTGVALFIFSPRESSKVCSQATKLGADGGCFIHLGQRPRRRAQWRTQHEMYAIVYLMHILTVVKEKTDSKDKPEEDDSADEAEETPGTASNPLFRNSTNEIDVLSCSQEKEEKVKEEEDRICQRCHQTIFPTESWSLKTFPVWTISNW